jgi:hypothetical protein
MSSLDVDEISKDVDDLLSQLARNVEVVEETDDTEVAVAYEITAYPSDLTLSVINEMWKHKDIVIPDYQRNFVWSIKQSSDCWPTLRGVLNLRQFGRRPPIVQRGFVNHPANTRATIARHKATLRE